MTFEKSKKTASSPVPASKSVNPPKKVISNINVGSGGSSGNKGGSGSRSGGSSGNNMGGSGNSDEPSPWLDHPQHPNNGKPNPNSSASFVEYLRWMRSLDQSPAYKDATKVQILQTSQEKANYTERLRVLTKRTKLIAGEGNWFEVSCPWRIRVGGIRGVESMLIPAFDALGMPYIPSSTLRGVARNAAIREFMEEGLDWNAAEKKIAPYFGSIDTKNSKDQMGKVTFLDAYPMPSKDGGLSVDIANNIWKWEGDRMGEYSPNPNPFLSLKNAKFVIGIRASSTGSNEELDRVRKWLVKGLQNGVGSQVNSGYGVLTCAEGQIKQPFFRVGFAVRGQLIHGRQKFTQWQWNHNRNRWDMRGQAEAEVRPVAFKSMLRYWFRAFALGVLPIAQVKLWEATLFGAIDPQKRGYFNISINDGVLVQKEARASRDGQGDNYGVQEGTLLFQY
jgi:CRISPR-associated protein Cmr6